VYIMLEKNEDIQGSKTFRKGGAKAKRGTRLWVGGDTGSNIKIGFWSASTRGVRGARERKKMQKHHPVGGFKSKKNSPGNSKGRHSATRGAVTSNRKEWGRGMWVN